MSLPRAVFFFRLHKLLRKMRVGAVDHSVFHTNYWLRIVHFGDRLNETEV